MSTLLMWVGIFSISWDRVAQFQVGSFNVKLPTIAFAIALALTLVDNLSSPVLPGGRQLLVPIVVATVLVYGAVGVGALDRNAAMLQTVTVVLGAMAPFFAVYINIRLFGRVDEALTAFIRGGAFAAAFGVYQLIAFYGGFPQGIPYRAESGGLGRISSFSYEAGYFGYFLILVIAALFARAALRGEAVNRAHLMVFVGVLVLVNSRGTIFALPLLLLLLFGKWPKSSSRAKLWPLFVAVAYVSAAVIMASPAFFNSVFTRVVSVFDPTEMTSNGPRLQMYSIALDIARDSPFFGIGAGNLIRYVPLYGGEVGANSSSNSVVANNIWLQALLDGGAILLAFEILLVAVAIWTLLRKRNPVARMLMAGWVAAFLVASMITSYFWDLKFWVVLGMATAIASLGSQLNGIYGGGGVCIDSSIGKDKPLTSNRPAAPTRAVTNRRRSGV